MIEPTFDKNGYPTEETLEIIKNWKYSKETQWVDLLEYVNTAWHWTDYMRSVEAKNSFGDDVLEYTCITGGWSGNESLIAAMKQNYMFWSMCWRESHRGGKYIFEAKR